MTCEGSASIKSQEEIIASELENVQNVDLHMIFDNRSVLTNVQFGCKNEIPLMSYTLDSQKRELQITRVHHYHGIVTLKQLGCQQKGATI